jgi:RHS repeat-associated protein
VLDTVTSPSRTQSWSDDALGNWSSVTTNGTQQNRTHNQQNEATVVGGNNLTFDNNGNTTTNETGKTLIYDAWNRLVKVKSGSNTLSSYQFDALGRRIVENSGTARDLYFSSQWQVLEERINGVANAQYVWSPVYVDALVERDRDPTGGGNMTERLYVQQDANWNVTALVNTSGTVLERYVYDPFGAVTFLTASFSTLSSSAYAWIYLFQGGRYDPATKLFQFRHRDYSPSLGRWLQLDPIAFAGADTDLYRCLHDSPLCSSDPTGLYGPDDLYPANGPRPNPYRPGTPSYNRPSGSWPATLYYKNGPVNTGPFDANPANWNSAWQQYKKGCFGYSFVQTGWDKPLAVPGTAWFLTLAQALAYQTSLGGPNQATILGWQVAYDPKLHDPVTNAPHNPNLLPGQFNPADFPGSTNNPTNVANLHQRPGTAWFWAFANHGYSPDISGTPPTIYHTRPQGVRPNAGLPHDPTNPGTTSVWQTYYVVVPKPPPPPGPPKAMEFCFP